MTQRDAGAAVVLPRTAEGIAENYAGREARRRQSSARICMEHTIGEEKKWRPLQRYLGRRDSYAETHTAIAGLVSDRAARRPTRRHEYRTRARLEGRLLPVQAPDLYLADRLRTFELPLCSHPA
ncbi:hypothetical protein OG571_38475 [Streptomyces sp. NBC_01369]|uniref:hypothetical protein n=1 Tax=Streptomyces sp. NBC_01369 TaxID=2903842 RepID=UPI00325032E3